MPDLADFTSADWILWLVGIPTLGLLVVLNAWVWGRMLVYLWRDEKDE